MTFDSSHDWWSTTNAAMIGRSVDALVAAFPRASGSRALDIGAGDGRLTRQLEHRASCTGVAVDMDLTRMQVGQRVVCGDAQRLPVRDGQVNLACLRSVLHHVGDAGAVLREARRCLTPGGLLLVVEPDVPEWLNAAWTEINRFREDDDVTFRSERALAREIETAGFTVAAINRTDLHYPDLSLWAWGRPPGIVDRIASTMASLSAEARAFMSVTSGPGGKVSFTWRVCELIAVRGEA